MGKLMKKRIYIVSLLFLSLFSDHHLQAHKKRTSGCTTKSTPDDTNIKELRKKLLSNLSPKEKEDLSTKEKNIAEKIVELKAIKSDPEYRKFKHYYETLQEVIWKKIENLGWRFFGNNKNTVEIYKKICPLTKCKADTLKTIKAKERSKQKNIAAYLKRTRVSDDEEPLTPPSQGAKVPFYDEEAPIPPYKENK